MSNPTEEYRIGRDQVQPFATALVKAGYLVMVESADGRGFTAFKDGIAFSLDTSKRPTKNSFKPTVFPRTEPIFHYRKEIGEFTIIDALAEAPRTVIFGARPCDAASIGILAKVFNWDYKDDFFNSKAESTIVVGTPCAYRDEQCFCTSVGLAPDSTKGSDVFLTPLEDRSIAVRAVTEKGRAFLEEHAALLTPAPAGFDSPADELPAPPVVRFDAEKVRQWVDGHFDDEYWSTVGETCLGCGQCAFVCPVCHCFDIVDENDTYVEGRRMKNWDYCQAGLFTRHASGHNPRDGQPQRYRQRISHKFAYYPKRFGEILCTGCGRCSRGCAVGMDIGEIAAGIGTMASETPC